MITEREIPGFPGYLASSAGEIISVRRRTRRVMKPYMNHNTKQLVVFDADGQRKTASVPALIASAFIPGGNRRGTLSYRDGDPSNCRPGNLFWNEDCVLENEPSDLTAVPGFASLYVTPSGEVFSRMGSAKDGRLRKLSTRIDSNGYPRVSFNVGGVCKAVAVHRLVAITFCGPAKPGRELVRHLNGVKRDSSRYNLSWGNNAENQKDGMHHRRVHEVRSFGFLEITELADRYHLPASAIEAILLDVRLEQVLLREQFEKKFGVSYG